MPDPTTTTAPAPETAPPTPPVETGPTADELAAGLAQERQRAAQWEQEAIAARRQAEMAWTARRPETPTQSDPLKDVANQFLTDPDAASRSLRSYLDTTIKTETDKNAAIIRQQTAMEMARQQQQLMYQNLAQQHPDLTTPERFPELAGEAVKIKMQYEARGLQQDPSVYLAKAAEALKARARTQTQPPPPAYVEGGASPNANPGMAPIPEPGKNELEEIYGMKPGTITPRWTADQHVEEKDKFIRSENAEREKHRIMPVNMDTLETARYNEG